LLFLSMPAAMAARHATAEDSGAIVKGFRVLRIPLAPGSPISRSLLVKRHEGRTAEEQVFNGRTLFVTHLDNFVTEAQLSRSFTTFGAVEKVELKSVEKKAPKAEMRADHVHVYVNFARVIFAEAESLEKALAAASGRIAGAAVLPLPPSELKERLRTGRTLYRDAVELKQEVDRWMADFDKKEEEKKLLARESALVDEDGFQKVVSGLTRTTDGFSIRAAKRPSLKTGAFSESTIAAQEANASGKRKKRSKEMPDFYRFQEREQKRQEIVDHRKRMAEDMDKVYRLKKRQKVRTAAYVEKPIKKGQEKPATK